MTSPDEQHSTDRPPNVTALAAQLDSTLEFFFERMNGLDDAEYLWEPGPVTWSLRPPEQVRTRRSYGQGTLRYEYEAPEPVPPPLRSIAWLMWHLSVGCAMRADYTTGTRSATFDSYECPATAKGGLDLLRTSLSTWRAVFDELAPDEYAQIGRSSFPWGLDPELPLADILWWQNREVIHHCAEMMFLRDLYAYRAAS